jgi:hypothetical protein
MGGLRRKPRAGAAAARGTSERSGFVLTSSLIQQQASPPACYRQGYEDLGVAPPHRHHVRNPRGHSRVPPTSAHWARPTDARGDSCKDVRGAAPMYSVASLCRGIVSLHCDGNGAGLADAANERSNSHSGPNCWEQDARGRVALRLLLLPGCLHLHVLLVTTLAL